MSASANVIPDWDEKAVAVVTPMPPYTAERVMGMVHIAMFDAVNSIERRFQRYLVQLPAEPTTSKEAAAASAAAAVLATIDSKIAGEMKIAIASYLASIPDGAAKSDASSSARRLRHGSWRLARTTAPMRPMTIGREPRPASMCQHPSPQPRRGRTGSPSP